MEWGSPLGPRYDEKQSLAALRYRSYIAVFCGRFTVPRLRFHVTETLPVFPPSLHVVRRIRQAVK